VTARVKEREGILPQQRDASSSNTSSADGDGSGGLPYPLLNALNVISFLQKNLRAAGPITSTTSSAVMTTGCPPSTVGSGAGCNGAVDPAAAGADVSPVAAHPRGSTATNTAAMPHLPLLIVAPVCLIEDEEVIELNRLIELRHITRSLPIGGSASSIRSPCPVPRRTRRGA